ncbi:MAG: cytochrome c-type biogenesis protein CcmH [Rhodobacteraceae bacterium]|nr:cytochrome c-type biogenesis protein CcmH [Paracoccaceae bacterium]
MRRAVWTMLALMICTPLWAVQPDELLPDAALEARARTLSAQVRCPVCQGESIDDSNATLARDLRLLLRERLLAGDTDDQAIDYLVARYGEFILFKPRAQGANLLLWGAGPLMFGGALLGAGLYIRRRQRLPVPAQPLTDAEEARLSDLLQE